MNSHDSQSSPQALNVPVAHPATELTAEQLQFQITATVDFRTTEELSVSHEFAGQKRARALDLGVGIPNSGYNIW